MYFFFDILVELWLKLRCVEFRRYSYTGKIFSSRILFVSFFLQILNWWFLMLFSVFPFAILSPELSLPCSVSCQKALTDYSQVIWSFKHLFFWVCLLLTLLSIFKISSCKNHSKEYYEILMRFSLLVFFVAFNIFFICFPFKD